MSTPAAAAEVFGDEDFEARVLRSDGPVLVEFLADWCVPSRHLERTLDRVAKTHGDRLRVGTVDVDAHPGAAERFGIRGLPTLVLFEAGEERLRRVGLVDHDDLERLLEARLSRRAD